MTNADRPGTPEGYHHGDLRAELLRQAVGLARAGGPDAVVLRDVQRRAGVSNSAAYRHYADRQSLLTAVTDHALGALADRMIDALNRLDTHESKRELAMARFRATGAAYIDFALSEPGLFRTAFPHRTAIDVSESGPQSLAGQASPSTPAPHEPFAILIACVDDLVATGQLDPASRDGVDESAFAAVHGLAVLFLDGPLATLGPAEQAHITRRLLKLVQDGIH